MKFVRAALSRLSNRALGRLGKEIPRREYSWLSAKSFLALLAVWSLATYGGFIPTSSLPAPHTVVTTLFKMFADEGFAVDVFWSVFRVTAGFAIAAALAVPLGILAGSYRRFDAMVSPLSAGFRYIPATAFVSLLILWLGIDEAAKIALIALGTFLYILVLIVEAMERLAPTLLEAASTLGATERQTLRRVVIPAVAPDVMNVLKVMIGAAWTYLVVAEYTNPRRGMGMVINQADRYVDKAFAAIAALGLIGLVTHLLFEAAYKVFFPWKSPRNTLFSLAAEALAHRAAPSTPPAPAQIPAIQTPAAGYSNGFLQVKNVTMTYPPGEVHPDPIMALKSTDLMVPKGQFLVLLGPPGCGMRPLLRTIAGLEAPTTGSVCLNLANDRKWVRGPGADRGMVFPTYTSFPWLTVWQNIAFPLLLNKALSKDERRAKVDELIHSFGLQGLEHRYPDSLPGGMRQRVALARALAAVPEVLLLDEPFGLLDAQTRRQMQHLLINAWRERGCTVIFATHDVEEAVYLAQRICVIDGRPPGSGVAGSIYKDTMIQLPGGRLDAVKWSTEFVDYCRAHSQYLATVGG